LLAQDALQNRGAKGRDAQDRFADNGCAMS
jgi:hypothetical protein